MTQAFNLALLANNVNSSGQLNADAGLYNTVNVANGGTNLSATPTNGQLLIGNGTGYTLAELTAGSGITVTNGAGSISISAPSASGTRGQVFSTVGTGQTFTIPTGVTSLKVTVVAGGGGGGSAIVGSCIAGSGGNGGGGGAAISYLTGLTSGNTLTVAVGAAGTASSTASGGTGGTSSVSSGTEIITTISATGGAGGARGAGVNGSPGTGGSASGGGILFNGSNGSIVSVNNNSGLGFGGTSAIFAGYGYHRMNSTGTGGAAETYGGGGGGAWANGTSNVAGGVGFKGIVIFEW